MEYSFDIRGDPTPASAQKLADLALANASEALDIFLRVALGLHESADSRHSACDPRIRWGDLYWHIGIDYGMIVPMAKRLPGLTERQIRLAAKSKLAAQLRTGDLLVEELAVEHGNARIDVACLSDQLGGYELKSDFDTLDRLALQMHAYHGVFDGLTLVSTADYLAQAEKLLPPWWGLWCASARDETVEIAVLRDAQLNPRRDTRSLVALLWRDEAAALLQQVTGKRASANANRARLYDALASEAPADVVHAGVLACLRSRDALICRAQGSQASAAQGDASSEPSDGWWRPVATW